MCLGMRGDWFLTFFCFGAFPAPTESGGAWIVRFFVLVGFRPALKVGVPGLCGFLFWWVSGPH